MIIFRLTIQFDNRRYAAAGFGDADITNNAGVRKRRSFSVAILTVTFSIEYPLSGGRWIMKGLTGKTIVCLSWPGQRDGSNQQRTSNDAANERLADECYFFT